MRITPMDMQQKQFRRRFKGYDQEEVISFLHLISGEAEELRKENAALKKEASDIGNQLKEFNDLEVALRDAVIKTQEFVETYRANAERQGELLQKEAELRAGEILEELHRQIVRIHEEITGLKGIRKQFKQKMTELIESCMGRLTAG